MRVGAVAGLVMAATGWPTTSAHAEPSTICGKVLTEDTVLPHEQFDCSGFRFGLIIGKDGITVDLNLSRIQHSSVGIYNNGHDHVTIKYGKVLDAEVGVRLVEADYNRLIAVNMEYIHGRSLVVRRSNHVVIDEGHVSYAGQFLFDHDRDLTVRNAGLYRFPLGDAAFVLRDTDHSSFLNNSFGSEGGGGIRMIRSDHNVVRDTTVIGSELFGPGIELLNSDYNRIENNTAINLRSRGGGITLDSRSTGNAVVGNLTEDNPDNGIFIANPRNVVSYNRSDGNELLGISAPDGVKGKGNTASGNGDPRQCTGVTCTPSPK